MRFSVRSPLLAAACSNRASAYRFPATRNLAFAALQSCRTHTLPFHVQTLPVCTRDNWVVIDRSLNSNAREALPFIPKKVLIVSKVTLLNYESRKAYLKPWIRLNPDEREHLCKHLEREGFNISELIESHSNILNVQKYRKLYCLKQSHGNILVLFWFLLRYSRYALHRLFNPVKTRFTMRHHFLTIFHGSQSDLIIF